MLAATIYRWDGGARAVAAGGVNVATNVPGLSPS